MTARVEIDLNVRVQGNATYTGFEDVQGKIALGDEVVVFESESGVEGTGRVTDIDFRRQLVYLAVDWESLQPDGVEDREPSVSAAGEVGNAGMFVAWYSAARAMGVGPEGAGETATSQPGTTAWNRGNWHWTPDFVHLLLDRPNAPLYLEFDYLAKLSTANFTFLPQRSDRYKEWFEVTEPWLSSQTNRLHRKTRGSTPYEPAY